MTPARRGAILLAVQCALVLTTAGKYLWERHTRPHVWTRVELLNQQELSSTARDPKNRYMQVQLFADACTLPPRLGEPEVDPDSITDSHGAWTKKHRVRKDLVHTIAKDGKLTLVEAEGIHTRDKQDIYWDLRKPCTEARLTDVLRFYVPSAIAMPTQLAPDQTVWALVTVPAQGPPRPLELAISDASGFHPLGQK